MQRPRLMYRPRWSAELAGYAYNATRKYWPALLPWYEWEDLMQEAQVVFLLCQRRYDGKVDNPRWFMALYKTALRNRLVTLVTHVPRYSLLDGLETPVLEQAEPDALQALLELIEALPVGLRLVLNDLCRPKGRLVVSLRTMDKLKGILYAQA